MERIVITATEAAKALGTSPNRIKELLDTGELPAYRDGNTWSIPISLLHRYAETKAITEAKERREKCQR